MRTYHHWGSSILSGVIFLVLLASSAAASEMFPLEPGLEWSFIQPAAPAPDWFHTVIGPADFHGASTIAMTNTVSAFGESNTTTLYYSETPSGGIAIHGSSRHPSLQPGVLQENVFSPPILLIDAPLTDGASWGGEYLNQVYEDGVLIASWSIPYTVTAVQTASPISVPAGEFDAFQVTVAAENWEDRYWLAPGAGTVQWQKVINGEVVTTYQLYDSNAVVPLHAGSVGQLKGAFAD